MVARCRQQCQWETLESWEAALSRLIDNAVMAKRCYYVMTDAYGYSLVPVIAYDYSAEKASTHRGKYHASLDRITLR